MIAIPRRDIERIERLAESCLSGSYTVRVLLFDDGDASLCAFHTLDHEVASGVFCREQLRLDDDGGIVFTIQRHESGSSSSVIWWGYRMV